MVAALARGQSVAEIVEDFPSLSRDQVEAAIDYAKAYPKRGRPYPARSLKRTLAELANLTASGEEAEGDEVAPRRIP
jgi:acyl-CoA reductase-like NAD-dependent aldehyde dehydrogenase